MAESFVPNSTRQSYLAASREFIPLHARSVSNFDVVSLWCYYPHINRNLKYVFLVFAQFYSQNWFVSGYNGIANNGKYLRVAASVWLPNAEMSNLHLDLNNEGEVSAYKVFLCSTGMYYSILRLLPWLITNATRYIVYTSVVTLDSSTWHKRFRT